MNLPNYIYLPAVAAALNISVKTARRRVESGALPSFKEGGKVCVLISDLEAYIRARIQTTSTR